MTYKRRFARLLSRPSLFGPFALRLILGKSCHHPLRYLTGWARLLPDFIIIGAKKSGTSSLYTNLCRHPAIHEACRKEVHFFDVHYRRGMNWYRAHFPLGAQPPWARQPADSVWLTGEATPDYIHDPRLAERIARDLPHVKLIAILRNPVDRAYSHYQHMARNREEPLLFEAAIEAESGRLAGERDKMLADERYVSSAISAFGYVTNGEYADQLRSWFGKFEAGQVLVVRGEDYFRNPQQTLDQIHQFLGLPVHRSEALMGGRKPDRYPRMNPATRQRLAEHFRPHNQQLAGLLGRDMQW